LSAAGPDGTPASPAGVDVIVVAAGESRRMGGQDKLARVVHGQPLLAHTLAALARSPLIESIVVVSAPDRRDAVADAPWLPPTVRAVVDGGASRQESVRHGFEALEAAVPDPGGDRITLVHDGARPLVSTGLIAAVAASAAEHGAAIPVLPIAETVKRIVGEAVESTVDRSDLAVAQTPQAVRRSILRAALAAEVASRGPWTDEASLLEACRIPVHVIPGEPANIKVTVPADLERVAVVLSGGGGPRRTGIGHDAHGFGPGGPLVLGGVTFPKVPRLLGHSDGDVALHAVADALLGAAALGDLGRLFPAGPTTPRGIAGRDLLGEVIRRLAAAGWRPAGLDLTIIAGRPRLGGQLEPMRAEVAAILGLPTEAVEVKASSGNLEGAEGAGRAISALALATIEATA
jgi:2-C-methyl-D-erythritol 4-phosphate cytidylyltransferase / 2-C-methyl-D-erythritol 2,4-cyclodiphosphate synthase